MDVQYRCCLAEMILVNNKDIKVDIMLLNEQRNSITVSINRMGKIMEKAFTPWDSLFWWLTIIENLTT